MKKKMYQRPAQGKIRLMVPTKKMRLVTFPSFKTNPEILVWLLPLTHSLTPNVTLQPGNDRHICQSHNRLLMETSENLCQVQQQRHLSRNFIFSPLG